MSEEIYQKLDPSAEAAADAVLEEFNGDAHAAIKALLHDVDLLARDFNATVSRAFVSSKTRDTMLRIEPTPRNLWG